MARWHSFWLIFGALLSCVLVGLPAGAAAQDRFDLEPSVKVLKESIKFTITRFTPRDCAFDFHCVGGTGARKLMRLAGAMGNNGPDDFVVGNPAQHPNIYAWDDCTGQFITRKPMLNFSLYTMDGRHVAANKKESFCMEDLARFPEYTGNPALVPPGPVHTCTFQGISVGWMDVYDDTLTCQWIDVTDVPPGKYILRLQCNPYRIFKETTYANNVVETDVTIPAHFPH
ncbi:hypothetical protein CDCA_CDCA16G4177 [Cyanidium caldarium]|uniref:Uncharacterized protein n=1 Tax=Cyanidium caldarium TaxID=2771 RepID=A0AAV9J0P4_CYACA|nr:hypothetical protein CDCA_CDCA16G4177 [Cyanidium caldarium]